MKQSPLKIILKSNYCKLTFVLSIFIISLLIPKTLFYKAYTLLAITFILSSSMLITCIVKTIKERINLAKSKGTSFLGILSILIGFSAMQVCTIGAPICGASIGAGFLALLFPNFAFNLLEKYSVLIIFISLIIQIIALYFMGCLTQKIKLKEVKK